MKRPLPDEIVTNRLLDTLPAKTRKRIVDACDVVDLAFEESLDSPGDAIDHVYFPLRSFISLLTPVGVQRRLEVALTGNEGVYGATVALGVNESPVHARVQGGGSALRLKTTHFRRELAREATFSNCINRYVYVLMSQLMRSAGCNRYHSVEQRVSRWMLMTSDRAHSPTFAMTHEFLANMIGVRREGVTEAAGTLQVRKLIQYARGVVLILDRKGLEHASCPCYRWDLTNYQQVMA